MPREESPGSSKERCRVTPGEGDLRESATESKPPCFDRVRAKGCGKSAPRWRQRQRHGKPHREQNRIGAAYGFPSPSRPGWLLEGRGNSVPRGMIIHLRKQKTEPGLQTLWHFSVSRTFGRHRLDLHCCSFMVFSFRPKPKRGESLCP